MKLSCHLPKLSHLHFHGVLPIPLRRIMMAGLGPAHEISVIVHKDCSLDNRFRRENANTCIRIPDERLSKLHPKLFTIHKHYLLHIQFLKPSLRFSRHCDFGSPSPAFYSSVFIDQIGRNHKMCIGKVLLGEKIWEARFTHLLFPALTPTWGESSTSPPFCVSSLR